MGLITWIKNKYYTSRFDRAHQLYQNGEYTDAIKILKNLLNDYPDAQEELLSVYHTQILKGTLLAIKSAAHLYQSYPSLKQSCLKFSKDLYNISIRDFIAYSQELYCANLSELGDSFIMAATDFIISHPSESKLDNLTSNNFLLKKLAESLFEKVKNLTPHEISDREKICVLILPYYSSQDFFCIYSNIRLEQLANKPITITSIKNWDKLFKDVISTYSLVDSDRKKIFDRVYTLANAKLSGKKYTESLLLSRRLLEQYTEAGKCYADSAFQMYHHHLNQKLIEEDILYKAIGNNLIVGLERFIPYASYKTKYVSLVCAQLKEPNRMSISENEELLLHAWNQTKDISLISASLSGKDTKRNESYAIYIVDKSDVFLKSVTGLNEFVKNLITSNNTDFVTTILEELLDRGANVLDEYVSTIIKLAEGTKVGSKDRIDVINRGLCKGASEQLYAKKATYLEDYVDSVHFDTPFAITSAQSLIGKNDNAEILLSKVYLSEANKSTKTEETEKWLFKALDIKINHSDCFNEKKYETLLSDINCGLILVAENSYKTDENHAISILYKLRDYKVDWYDTYAQLRLKTINKQPASSVLAEQLLAIIQEGSNIASKVKEILWSKYVDVVILNALKDALEVAIDALRNCCELLKAICEASNKDQLIKKVNSSLCDKLYEFAKKEECSNNYNQAIGYYNEINTLENNYLDATLRLYICKLKVNCTINKTERKSIELILASNYDTPTQKDLAYRWCIYLLQLGEIDKVEKYNNLILEGDPQLAAVCREEEIMRQLQLLENLNDEITKLNTSELSASDAIKLGQSFSKIIQNIQLIVNIPQQTQDLLKEGIRIYAIEKFYDEGNFIQCLNGLKVQDSGYLSDPVALRNLAIMCLRAAEEGQMTDDNFKELLAIWATALYQQKIFVKSLDYTSWDDLYTFSLDNALGVLGEDEKLPENVNYEDCMQDGVVSILEVQKTLISRMDAALNNCHDYQQFFSAQLEAMDKLAAQDLDYPCCIVSPYLMNKSTTYKKDVTHALSKEIEGHYDNWETILEIGTLYGLTQGDFQRYAVAASYLHQAVDAIESMTRLKTAFSVMKINAIKDFPGLMSTLVSAVSTAMNKAFANDIDAIKLNALWGHIIKAISDDTLSFAFSNYINQYVVKSLNDKSMTVAQGAPLLLEIFEFCKCNPHLKRNIENIISALIHEYITTGNNNNLDVLNNALSSTRAYDQYVVSALKGADEDEDRMLCIVFSSNKNRFNALRNRIASKSQVIYNQFAAIESKIEEIEVQLELSHVVECVNNQSMSKCDALERVYNLYKSNKSNDIVCENLATLIPMCIIEYVIHENNGHYKVETIIQELKSNMSQTFRNHKDQIGQAYNRIWNQLSSDARFYIQNSPQNLTESGKALLRGLNYLKALS
jgi:hypothetical protein